VAADLSEGGMTCLMLSCGEQVKLMIMTITVYTVLAIYI
jgi:hypothetical protein